MSTRPSYDDKEIMRDDVPKSNMEKIRERYLTEPLSAREKDTLAIKKRALEERVAHGMPTHTEMWQPTPENCKKHRDWERANGEAIRELKRINRRLEPSNPDAGRIEYLRKQGEADKLARWS